MQKIDTVGIIGLGQFGAFAATLVPEPVKVLGFDPKVTAAPGRVELQGLAAVAACDVVVLAVPLASYEETLTAISGILRPQALLVDICSVKSVPESLIQRILPHHRGLLLTHPLFGPHSALGGTGSLTLVVTAVHGDLAGQTVEYCEQTLGLSIVRCTSAVHDRTMAQTQALSFFVSRALAATLVDRPAFKTPSFDLIERLAAHDSQVTDALYQTIVNGNPYAAEARSSLVRELGLLDQS